MLSEMTLAELWQLFPIFLVEPRSEWADWYAVQAAELQKHMPDAVISHVGSTAIKGIWAKNIVDILAELPVSGDMDAACALLCENGWTCMSREAGRISLNRGYTPEGFADEVYHLHLRYAGDRDEVYFRDYMNAHPEAAKKYEQLKLSLWKEYEHDRDGYTRAKTEFVQKYTRMGKISFEHMENDDFPEYAAQLFDILADNMSVIAPTGNARDDDYAMWRAAVGEGMKHPARRIVLIKHAGGIVGYFQYYTNAGTFMMEEIQIKPGYRRDYGIFRGLYGYLIPRLPGGIEFVKAYANKKNIKSDGILKRLGLEATGENSTGNSLAYCGKYADLIKWYEKGRS